MYINFGNPIIFIRTLVRCYAYSDITRNQKAEITGIKLKSSYMTMLFKTTYDTKNAILSRLRDKIDEKRQFFGIDKGHFTGCIQDSGTDSPPVPLGKIKKKRKKTRKKTRKKIRKKTRKKTHKKTRKRKKTKNK